MKHDLYRKIMENEKDNENTYKSKQVSEAFLLGSKSKSDTQKDVDISRWHSQMNFLFINNLNYSYRAKTEAIFKGGQPSYFDFFFVDD